VSVIHLFESFGWWRASELKKLHFAEEWNEMHHLLIMESLGGNDEWKDRFLANHTVIAYYWALVILYVFSPDVSYNFSLLVEAHAVDTYEVFLKENAEKLKKLPPPPIAVNYYTKGDLYLFDVFQSSRMKSGDIRRPPCDNLYDVFQNIIDDEKEHEKTMLAMETWSKGGQNPILSLEDTYSMENNSEYGKKREEWIKFAAEANA